jgi:hypothetical protein
MSDSEDVFLLALRDVVEAVGIKLYFTPVKKPRKAE